MRSTAPLPNTTRGGFLSLHKQQQRTPRRPHMTATVPHHSPTSFSSSTTQASQRRRPSPRERRLSLQNLERKKRRQHINASKAGNNNISFTDDPLLTSSQRDVADQRSDYTTCNTNTNTLSSNSNVNSNNKLTLTEEVTAELFGSVNHHPLIEHFSQHSRDMLSQVRLRRQSRRDGVVQWEPRRLGVNYAHIVNKYRERREEIRDETREQKDVSRKIKHSFDQHRWLVGHGHKAQQQKKQAHLKRLRQWWEFLDADGGGTLSVDELEDPLVSVGLARGRADVEKLIETHDTSGEGELSFENFTSMLTAKDSAIVVPTEEISATVGGSGGGKNNNKDDDMHMKNKKDDDTNKKKDILSSVGTKKKKKKKSTGKNAVMQLFDDLEDGKFGNKDVGLPLQITTFRRQMLLNVHLSPDPVARAKGLMVLNGIIDTKRSQRKDLEEAAAEVDLRTGLEE